MSRLAESFKALFRDPVEARGAVAPQGAVLSFAGTYALLGRLLEYPSEGFRGRLGEAWEALSVHCPEAAASLGQFRGETEALPPSRLEEAYLRAFDVAPLATPYVSIHLFGEENYRRGEFMARWREAYEAAGFDAGGELPDHLSLLLRFAPGLSADERRDLLECCLKEPLKTMREALERSRNPYRNVLRAVQETLETDREGRHA